MVSGEEKAKTNKNADLEASEPTTQIPLTQLEDMRLDPNETPLGKGAYIPQSVGPKTAAEGIAQQNIQDILSGQTLSRIPNMSEQVLPPSLVVPDSDAKLLAEMSGAVAKKKKIGWFSRRKKQRNQMGSIQTLTPAELAKLQIKEEKAAAKALKNAQKLQADLEKQIQREKHRQEQKRLKAEKLANNEHAQTLVDGQRIALRLGMVICACAFVVAVLVMIFWPTHESPVANSKSEPFAKVETREETSNVPLAPEIAAVAIVNAQGQTTENPDRVAMMIDNSPNTVWQSLAYPVPTLDQNRQFGISVTLKQETTLRKVVLDTNTTGGKVSLRIPGPDELPKDAKVILETNTDGITELNLPKAEKVHTFVIWFSELPKDVSGLNRVNIKEISVS